MLREVNERTLLEALLTQSYSRAGLATATGLSRPTIAAALSVFEKAKLIRRCGFEYPSSGPAAVVYEFNPAAGFVIGIDIGRTWLRAAVADLHGVVLGRADWPNSVPRRRAIVETIHDLVTEACLVAGVRLRAATQVVIALPGVVDPHDRSVKWASLADLHHDGLLDGLQRTLGVPTSFENDVNLAAVAEHNWGVGREISNFVLLWLSSGLGVGIIMADRLYRGARGAAGELGFFPMMREPAFESLTDKIPGFGGRVGLLDKTAASSRLLKRAAAAGLKLPSSAAVYNAARSGDEAAKDLVKEQIKQLALAANVVAELFDPEAIIVHGGLVKAAELEPYLSQVDRNLRGSSPLSPRLLDATVAPADAMVQGAIALALPLAYEELFSRR